jgi:glycosyltransferase involved in cell wall biosynthesis
MTIATVRILFVCGLGLGGAELMMLKLLAHIDRKRIHPAVISISKSADIAEQVRRLGIEVHAIDLLSARGFFGGVFHLFELMRRIRPDILQGWMIHGNFAALLAGVCLRVPVFWGIRHSRLLRGTDKSINLFIEWVLGRVSRLPARIIYNSEAGKRHHEAMGYYPGRALVIPNGFDAEKFAPSLTARQAVRRSLDIPDDAVVIGMIARYDPAKDHRNFLAAAALLRKSTTKTLFVLAGRGCDWTNAELVSIIKGLSLGDAVKLIGERSDVHELINAFDIGTLSSASEGFANAVGECMCCAVPCVVTDVGDSGWIVGDSGITVPPKDPVSLCRGWTELIEAGPSVREARGRRARERIVSCFSIDAVAKKYEAAYLHNARERE